MKQRVLMALTVVFAALTVVAPTAQAASPRRAGFWKEPFQGTGSSLSGDLSRLPANIANEIQARRSISRRPGRRPDLRNRSSRSRPARQFSGHGLDDGELMLDTARYLSSPLYYPNGVGIASDGSDFLVVWGGGYPADILAARVDAQGRLKDTAALVIFPMVNGSPGRNNDYPEVAFDGVNYFAVWQTLLWDSLGNPEQAIFGGRVTPAGVVLDPDGIRLTLPTGPQAPVNARVVYGGGNYFVTFTDDATSSLFGARVTPSGTVLDPDGITISQEPLGSIMPLGLTSDGTDFLALWERDTGYVWAGIFGARVNQSGVLLDTAGIALSRDTLVHGLGGAAFDGTNYLVVTNAGEYPEVDIGATRLTPAGALLDSTPVTVFGAALDQYPLGVDFDGTNYLVAWNDGRDPDSLGQGDLRVGRLTPSLTVLDTNGIVVDSACQFQVELPVAFNGANHCAIWLATSGVRAARISPAGAVLDPGGIRVSFGYNRHYRPTVASDGSSYFAVWLDGRRDEYYDVYGTRVSASGQVLDEPARLIARVSEPNWVPPPALGFGAGNYLAVWCDFTGGTGDLYGARITPAGELLDSLPFAICTAPEWQMLPSIACDGTNYLVTWSDFRDGPDYPDVYAARVTAGGTVLDPDGFPVVSGPWGQGWSSAAFDGTNYLLTWLDDQSGYGDIFAARLTPAGVVLDTGGFAVCQSPFDQLYPALDFDGTNYFVTWQDFRDDTMYFYFSGTYGARIRPNGQVLDPEGQRLFLGDMRRTGIPRTVFDGVGHIILWSHFDYLPSVDYCIRGLRVDGGLNVIDSFRTSSLGSYAENDLLSLTKGAGRQTLVAWRDIVGEYQGQNYSTYRAMAKLGPFGGIAEAGERLPDARPQLAVFPSPCRGRATVSFARATGGPVELRVYALSGRSVRSLVLPDPDARTVSWDGRDDAGRALPNGVYVVRLTSGGASANRQVVLMR